MNPEEQSQCQSMEEQSQCQSMVAYSTQSTNHQECTGLPHGSLGKSNRVSSSVPLSGGSCDLWCPGWDNKDLTGSPEQDPADTSRPEQQSEIWSAAGRVASGVHLALEQPEEPEAEDAAKPVTDHVQKDEDSTEETKAPEQADTTDPPESLFKKLAPSRTRYTILRDEL